MPSVNFTRFIANITVRCRVLIMEGKQGPGAQGSEQGQPPAGRYLFLKGGDELMMQRIVREPRVAR